MSPNKKKIIEILLTALISAGIAFLQSLLIPIQVGGTIESTPIVAGAIGGIIRCFRS